MNKFRLTIKLLVTATFLLAFASLAQAQATRTWVSGVGDDVNPCSRTAPCKTWAGAISKTAVNGEINALDPAGYGTLNITKGITIDGSSTHASSLSTGTTGFIINISAPVAADRQMVILRNLSINGTGGSGGVASGGQQGVRILAAKSVSIQNCVIFAFTSGNAQGIRDERTAANSFLSVDNCTIENNGTHGIIIGVGASGSNQKASISNTRIFNNGGIGIAVIGGAQAQVSNTVSAFNTTAGYEAEGGSSLNLESCVASRNGTGVLAQTAATIRMSNVFVGQNTTGVNNNASTVRSFGNNRIDTDNTTPVSGTILGPGTGGPTQQ
ncbi:MAG TPA: right-handed parallel beta-helix repeat-containing protein [Pyrinomonadaceae bacterium]|nr:right-handed parallel beta-helix repeat-containing protein [Pyrinomonadaceae bacterium]